MKKFFRSILIIPLLLLGGCQWVLLSPDGVIAQKQSDIMMASIYLMCLIVIPLFIAIIIIAIRYRFSNKKASYAPEWEHSTKLELLIWAAPLAIVVTLGAMTWVDTHLLDPFRPLNQPGATKLVQHQTTQQLPEELSPLEVDVVAMNWKWLFIYPDYGIAVVNQVAAPINVPIQFNITATDVMNSFFIPSLAGQIYAMPGMRTQLSARIDKTGNYKGFSANYSGAGFNWMNFKFHALSRSGFKNWIQKVKTSGQHLSKPAYIQLTQPSSKVPVTYYSQYSPNLFMKIVRRCFSKGSSCHAGSGDNDQSHSVEAPRKTAYRPVTTASSSS